MIKMSLFLTPFGAHMVSHFQQALLANHVEYRSNSFGRKSLRRLSSHGHFLMNLLMIFFWFSYDLLMIFLYQLHPSTKPALRKKLILRMILRISTMTTWLQVHFHYLKMLSITRCSSATLALLLQRQCSEHVVILTFKHRVHAKRRINGLIS